jgi:phospholipase C
MGYYDWNDLPYYYELGFQFGTSDRYFLSVLTRTTPNRMYLFAATSFGNIGNDSPPSGGWSKTTIFDRLDAAGVSWRVYTVDNTNSLADWATYSRDSNKVFPISQYFSDIKSNSTTPQVVFIDRGGGSSATDEHPGSDIQNGAHEVASIVNALLASPTWQSSAFFLSWDEPGGFYDHVSPVAMTAPDNIAPVFNSSDGTQPGDFAHSGLRVPLVVLSPWAKPHFVSHVARDHTSILKFIETRFNLQPLTARDSNADNMMEFFDFSTPQFATPPALPAQPTNGNCNQSQETTNSGLAHAVQLNWDASKSVVASYNVYRGTQTGGPYTLVSTAVVPATSFEDDSVQSGSSYFYTVTAVGTDAVESDPSNETEAVIPNA